VNRRGLTLIEVIVVMAIIGIILALLLPAVQVIRESARRVQCTSHLKQLALAIHQYEETHGVVPRWAENNYSFHVALLPYLEQENLYRQFDLSVNQGDYTGPLRRVRVNVFECPSDSASRQVIRGGAATNYFGNAGSGVQRYGFNGVFGYPTHGISAIHTLPLSAITDGLSNTALLAEVLPPDQSYHRLRVTWVAPIHDLPDQFDLFVEICRNLPDSSPNHFTVDPSRGRPWIEAGHGRTLYNHTLPPNSVCCMNGPNLVISAYSSASLHRLIVNLARADGSVQPVNQSIDLETWRKLASRAGNP
jgi:prepilin-type N-terminal cleavage/methylation domain-containing protein